MNRWADIESAVVDRLRAVTYGQRPLLATVAGHGWRDRRSAVTALQNERMPAAFVSVIERSSGDKDFRRAGPTRLSVLLAERSERAEAESRLGGVDSVGVYVLSEQVADALQDFEAVVGLTLLLIDDQAAGGTEGMLVREQRYEVRRVGTGPAPTFGGAALVGTESQVAVRAGALQRAASSFSFPGIDGVFERHMGLRGRSIVWQGQLRAADDAAINALEAGIEAEMATGQARTMVDEFGRSYADCVLQRFERQGPRKYDELSGQALQDFSLTFSQLS